MSDRWSGTSWRIVEVGDLTVTGGASLAFEDGGRVSGTGGRDRFAGTYAASGGVLTLGPLATTRMMGPPVVMAEEQAVLEVLSSPLAVVDAPVLEPGGPDEAEQVLEDEGGLVLEGLVTLQGTTTLRLAPATDPRSPIPEARVPRAVVPVRSRDLGRGAAGDADSSSNVVGKMVCGCPAAAQTTGWSARATSTRVRTGVR